MKIESLEKLEKMKGSAFVYRGELVELLGYVDHVGEDGDEVEIYLNNGKTIECKLVNLEKKLEEFRNAEGVVRVMATRKLDNVGSVAPNVIQELRDTILGSIRELKTDAGKVNQAKQIFQGVNTMINLAKMELEYRKYVDGFAEPAGRGRKER